MFIVHTLRYNMTQMSIFVNIVNRFTTNIKLGFFFSVSVMVCSEIYRLFVVQSTSCCDRRWGVSPFATLTFKTFHTNRPPHLTDLLQYYQPARCLHSSGFHQLVMPWHNLSLGFRGFRVSAPHVWNLLPINIRKIQSVYTFRCRLKTHFLQSAFSTPCRPTRQCAFLKISVLYKFFTYSLIDFYQRCEKFTVTSVASQWRLSANIRCLDVWKTITVLHACNVAMNGAVVWNSASKYSLRIKCILLTAMSAFEDSLLYAF